MNLTKYVDYLAKYGRSEGELLTAMNLDYKPFHPFLKLADELDALADKSTSPTDVVIALGNMARIMRQAYEVIKEKA